MTIILREYQPGWARPADLFTILSGARFVLTESEAADLTKIRRIRLESGA